MANPTFADVAKLIAAPGAPPEWLENKLRKLAPMLAFGLRHQDEQPGRTEMRKRLVTYREAAKTLRRLFEEDFPALVHIENAGGLIEDIGGMAHDLGQVIDGAENARAAISTNGGPSKAWAFRDALSAKGYCALVIREAWEIVHGEYPSARRPKAIETADAYWLASGGPRMGKTGPEALGWRDHFEAAARDERAHERETIRRLILAPPPAAPVLVPRWVYSEESGGLVKQPGAYEVPAANRRRRGHPEPEYTRERYSKRYRRPSTAC
jgi:hypothetical protein